MKLLSLSKDLEILESVSSRIEITKILAHIFEKSDVGEIDKITYLLLGKLAPSYKGIVFNLADKLMVQAIASAYSLEVDKIKELYKKQGDLGLVAAGCARRSESELTVAQVFDQMLDIASQGGEGSVDRRIEGLAQILRDCDKVSAKYIARIPLGKLRLGFSDLTILDALSWMETGGKGKRAQITKAYEVLPDIGLIAKMVKQKGIDQTVKSVKPVLGIPISPMLAQRLKSATEMIEKMGEVSVEPKYDGLRVLIHFKRGKFIKAFTRNLNDVSPMFPELKMLHAATQANELILDAEAVGLDEITKKLADFQTTMQRRRKHDISETANKIPLVFNIFDILYKDGASLIGKNYISRRKELSKTIKENSSFKLTPFILTRDPEIIKKEHEKYINAGLEGVLVKKTDSDYVPGRTGFRWVKMKEVEEAQGKLSDTIDCVIMGFTRGQGKRISFGVGQFLAGVRGGDSFKTITKVGTGLSDEQFKQLSTRLKGLVVSDKPKEYEVHKDLNPDFWVEPNVVVELAADDLTVSPKHTAGYAMRFPRLVKFRDDKSPKETTTVEEVKKLFELQKST